ncbi:MAG: hypothetical protein CMN79_03830 [Spirochaetales bacterium]|jgi:ABC-type multidrug transport system ATPase subunit|nr:hypothetical protein [Spirochaetales bacterium]|tara:strand:+ start:3521 stop:4225 length:705 start_codon:yes stop_codon:yes gene_type:complete
MIECFQIYKSFTKQDVLSGVNLKVRQNELSLLMGPNGCGKSTLLKIIMGLVNQDSGKIISNGKDVDDIGDSYKAHISYLPQDNDIFGDMIVKDIEDLFLNIKKIQQPSNVLRSLFDIRSFESIKFSNLSGGMKQKFLLSLVFITEPNLVMLDEPFVSLDQKSTKTLIGFLEEAKKQKTILITSHYFNKLEPLVDNILIMNNGQIILDSSIKELHANKDSRNLEGGISNLFDEYV